MPESDPVPIEPSAASDFALLPPVEVDTTSPIERTVYEAREHGAVSVPLSELIKDGKPDVYDWVAQLGFQLSLSRQGITFRTGGHVGLIPVNDRVTIEVKPKVPVRRIGYLLSVAQRKPIPIEADPRYYATDDVSIPGLLDVFTAALLTAIEPLITNGLHRVYRPRVADTSFPKGRFLLGETLRRHHARGMRHRATAAWHEQTVDNAPNRCLRYAVWYLARHYRAMRTFSANGRTRIRELNKAYHLFDGVALDLQRRFLQDVSVLDPNRLPEIRAYYRDAIRLSVAIIEERGIEISMQGEEVKLATLVVNLSTVFEAYLREVLRTRLAILDPRVLVLDGNHDPPDGGKVTLFHDPPTGEADVDIVVREHSEQGGDHRHPLILDAKYKHADTPDRDDVNQALAYSLAFRCDRVVIAMPKTQSGARGLRLIGEVRGVSLYQYSFDLAAEDIDAEEREFAESMHRFCRDTTGQ